MGKFGGTICVLAGIWSAYWSISNLSDYFAKPNEADVNLLKNTAAYVQEYKGNNPKIPLEHMQRTIQTLKQDKTFRSNLNQLEKDVIEIESRPARDPVIYQSDLRFIGAEADLIAEGERHKSEKGSTGILFGVFALSSLWFSSVYYRTPGLS